MEVRLDMMVKVIDRESPRYRQIGRVVSTYVLDGQYRVDFGSGDCDWVSSYPAKLEILD